MGFVGNMETFLRLEHSVQLKTIALIMQQFYNTKD